MDITIPVIATISVIVAFVLLIPFIFSAFNKIKIYAAKKTNLERKPQSQYTGGWKKVSPYRADKNGNLSKTQAGARKPNHPVNSIPVSELLQYLSNSRNEVLPKTLN